MLSCTYGSVLATATWVGCSDTVTVCVNAVQALRNIYWKSHALCSRLLMKGDIFWLYHVCLHLFSYWTDIEIWDVWKVL